MTRFDQAAIEADPDLPIIHITRDFAALPTQLLEAHTDPDLFASWVGPHGTSTEIDYWDARTGGQLALHQCPERGGAGVPRLLPRGG